VRCWFCICTRLLSTDRPGPCGVERLGLPRRELLSLCVWAGGGGGAPPCLPRIVATRADDIAPTVPLSAAARTRRIGRRRRRGACEVAQRLPPRVLRQQPDLCQLQRTRNVLEVGPRVWPAGEAARGREAARGGASCLTVALPSAHRCIRRSCGREAVAGAAMPLTPRTI